METKARCKSKTVWASVLTIIIGVLTALNVDQIGRVQIENVQANFEAFVDLCLGCGSIAAGFLALYGRLTAKTKLVKNKPLTYDAIHN